VGAVQCRGAPRLGAWRQRPRLQRGHRVSAGGRAPCHGDAEPATRAQRHSPCASQPPRGWRCGAVQCRGAPRPGAEAAHGHRVGGDRAPGHWVQNPPLELRATAPVQANHLEAGDGVGAVQCRCAPRLGRRATKAEAATRAPCRRGWPRAMPRGCRTRHSSSAPQPLCKPTTSRLEAGWALSSVEVLRDLGAGRPGAEAATRAPCRRGWPRAMPRGCRTRHSSSAPQPLCKPTTSRLEAGWALSSVEVLRDLGEGGPRPRLQRGHRVGAGGRAPGHGGCSTRHSSSAPQPLCKPTTSRLEVWCCPVSRCSATGRRATGRRGGTRAPCLRGWPRAMPRGCRTRHSSSVPQPLCKPTTSRLEVWCCPVSRCSATGRRCGTRAPCRW